MCLSLAPHSFLFKDQFIELTTSVPQDSDLYGLGETALPGGLLLPRNGEVVTMWARDSAPAETNINVYGTHPFYLQLNKGALVGRWGVGVQQLALCRAVNAAQLEVACVSIKPLFRM